MLTKNALVLGVISIVPVFLFGAPVSQAGLIGDEVTCSFQGTSNPDYPILTCDNPLAVVGAGAEFGLKHISKFLLSQDRYFDVDISDSHIRITFLHSAGWSIGTGPFGLTIGDLQWTSPSGGNTRIDDLEVQNFSTEGTSTVDRYAVDRSGVDIGDISFQRDAIVFHFGDTTWFPGSFVEWDLVVKQDKYIDTTSLSNLNGNSFDAVAVLRRTKSGLSQVLIKDTSTNELINAVPFFWSDWTPVAVASIDANGDSVADVAVLAVHRVNGKIKVQVRDALTGTKIIQMAFLSSEWSPIDLTVVDGNGDGIKDLGVLAVRDADDFVMMVVKDVTTRQRLTTVRFPKLLRQ